MRLHVQYLVFFGAFMTLALVMHYYIFSHLTYLLDIERTVWFWVFIVLSSMSWFLAMGLEMSLKNGASRAAQITASVWLGMLFMLLFILIGYDVVRLSTDIDTSGAGPVVIALAVSLVAYGVMNARWLRVREVDVPTRKLDGQLRIAHLTDIHLGSIYSPRFLRRIVDRVNALEPDLVLITGDLADGPHQYDERSFEALDDLKAPVYFTTGNHEYYAGMDSVLGLLARTKVRVLRNEMEDNGRYQLVGVDDSWDKEMVRKVLADQRLDPGKYTILMYHRPSGLQAAKEAGVDLMLTGHTHSGQFFPFQLLVRAVWRKVRGLYDLGGMYLYAAPGTGTWGPPMRVGTSSEITLLRVNGRHRAQFS